MSKFHLPEVNGIYKHNYKIAPLTWFKVGGEVDVLYKPMNLDDLSYFLKNLDQKVPVTILGNCSNVIVRDGGIEGVVIKLGKNFNHLNIDDNILTAGASGLNYYAANYLMDYGKSNLEFLIGIPGTIGGGIKMNAGAYGSEFKDFLEEITAIDRNGNIHVFKAKHDMFSYRKSFFPDDFIFIEAKFNLKNSTKKDVKAKMDEINLKRSSTQPITEKTGGSTFANPENHKAWELIDKVGMRGFSVGGAKFSDLHCNFMINYASASAKDLESLGNLAIKKVKDKFDIDLNWEIKKIGREIDNEKL